MTPRAMELALRKQRLRLRSATLRAQMAQHGRAFKPVFAGADRVAGGIAWLRGHPQLLVAAAVGLAVARPRKALLWVRRSFFVWRGWKRLRTLLAGG